MGKELQLRASAIHREYGIKLRANSNWPDKAFRLRYGRHRAKNSSPDQKGIYYLACIVRALYEETTFGP